MFEHFELAQESRSCLGDAELCQQGRVTKLRNAQCKCSVLCAAEDRSKFIRLSSEVLPDLVGPQLLALGTLCHFVHQSEEFFLNLNATDQWLRTVVGHENLIPMAWAESETWGNLIPGFVFHSNILPHDPYWSKLQATRDKASTRIYFPSYLLKEALEENKTLKKKLLEWKSTGNECDIEKHGRGRSEDNFSEEPTTSKLFWEIQAADVKLVRELAAGSDGAISLVTWRGGRFVRKDLKNLQAATYIELEIVKRFSHPNIVYNFGELCDGIRSSYFMEYMSNDLFSFIVDRVQRIVGYNEPPFSRYDSVDVLLQIAEAVRHMHQEKVDVVHCDLKSSNILVSVIDISDSVEHYLVKVADFGSARLGCASPSLAGFVPGRGTTIYSAPEVLRQLGDDTVRIDFPHKIDVYSFGILAFEVLTGKNNVEAYMRSTSTFKKGVINGTVRPPLRAEIGKQKVFMQDDDLISLIEICWHADPFRRPSFVEICKKLNKIRAQMLVPDQNLLQYDDSPRQASWFWNFMSFRGADAHKKQKSLDVKESKSTKGQMLLR